MTDAAFGGALALWPALLGGIMLGTAFYGSLWWTVRHGLPSSQPSRWFIGSMVLRTGIGLAAIYMIGDGQWERLTTCLLGFLMARPFVVRWTRRALMPIRNPRS